ncbi:MAG: protein kinase domain-containing protein [Candidatus Polarisedimenticolia bacterium]
MFGKKRRKSKAPAGTGDADAAAGGERLASGAGGDPGRIGRYTIVRPLGQGGMGRVYLGHDPVIGRHVAIKVITLRPDLSEEEGRQYRERFLREAQAAGAMVHPNIVSVYDVGQDPGSGSPYIVMEHVAGQDLKKLILSRAPLTPHDAVAVAAQIAAALDYAHRRGIVHRDIKPANVLLSERGQVKITDFGVARLPDSDLTRSDQFVGSPGFMSPEQLKGGAVDGRADLFALGVILYELLTGKPPFEGESVSEVLYRISTQPAEPPSDAAPDVSPDFDPILEKALSKDPEGRFQTGGEMIGALRALPAGQTGAVPGTAASVADREEADGAGPAPGDPGTASGGLRAPAAPPSPWWSLNDPWRLGGLMTVMLLTLVGVNWAILSLLRGPLGRAAHEQQTATSESGGFDGATPGAAADGPGALTVAGLQPPPGAGARFQEPTAPIAANCAMSYADPQQMKRVAAAKASVLLRAGFSSAPAASATLRLELKHRLPSGRVVLLVDGRTVLSQPFGAAKGRGATLVHTVSIPAGRHGVEVRLVNSKGTTEAKSSIRGTLKRDGTAVLLAEHRARNRGASGLSLAWAGKDILRTGS